VATSAELWQLFDSPTVPLADVSFPAAPSQLLPQVGVAEPLAAPQYFWSGGVAAAEAEAEAAQRRAAARQRAEAGGGAEKKRPRARSEKDSERPRKGSGGGGGVAAAWQRPLDRAPAPFSTGAYGAAAVAGLEGFMDTPDFPSAALQEEGLHAPLQAAVRPPPKARVAPPPRPPPPLPSSPGEVDPSTLNPEGFRLLRMADCVPSLKGATLSVYWTGLEPPPGWYQAQLLSIGDIGRKRGGGAVLRYTLSGAEEELSVAATGDRVRAKQMALVRRAPEQEEAAAAAAVAAAAEAAEAAAAAP